MPTDGLVAHRGTVVAVTQHTSRQLSPAPLLTHSQSMSVPVSLQALLENMGFQPGRQPLQSCSHKNTQIHYLSRETLN